MEIVELQVGAFGRNGVFFSFLRPYHVGDVPSVIEPSGSA
jgi:hypothetical protein